MPAKYPKLSRLIEEMAFDADLRCLPRRQWVWPANAKVLEDQAAMIPDEDVGTFVGGEFRTVMSMVGEANVQVLNQWMEDLFDGEPEAGTFFRRPGK